jgi:hypothetical protein
MISYRIRGTGAAEHGDLQRTGDLTTPTTMLLFPG